MRSIENGGTNTTSFGTDRRAGILCAPVPRESDVTPFCEIPKQAKDHDSGCEKQARLRPPSVSWQDRRRQEVYTFSGLHIFIKKIDESQQVGPVSFVPKLQGCPIAVPGSRHIEG